MGAEQSGDAEHKHSDLSSTGECHILYSFVSPSLLQKNTKLVFKLS